MYYLFRFFLQGFACDSEPASWLVAWIDRCHSPVCWFRPIKTYSVVRILHIHCTAVLLLLLATLLPAVLFVSVTDTLWALQCTHSSFPFVLLFFIYCLLFLFVLFSRIFRIIRNALLRFARSLCFFIVLPYFSAFLAPSVSSARS